MSALSFTNTPLSSALTDNLTRLGYLEMTPIQQQALPKVLAGQDIIGQGKTGSGKTATFSLGLLHNLKVKRFRVQALVLCPTRELADQVAKEIRKLASAIHNIKVLTLCGGTPMGPQIGSLEHGAHIIVGTPGRIEDHLRKGRIDLSELNTLVLDEADRMLEMGFEPALELIFSHCPQQRQTLLFSATFPDKIQTMANSIMRAPELIKVESNHSHTSISQHFFEVQNNDERLIAVALLLQQYQSESTAVFCNTKVETQALADSLINRGFSCAALHGDMEQKDRDQTLVRFANKSINILVATDVAARGLDIDNIAMVVNYHIAHDPEIHVHRIGRTGRAGNSGIACSLISNKEAHKVIRLEQYLNMEVIPERLPTSEVLNQPVLSASMTTIQIDGGKKQKLRPGDILGALTANKQLNGSAIGKIQMFPLKAYVAVQSQLAKKALKIISEGKMKGRNFRARIIK